MDHTTTMARLAALKRNTIIIESNVPADAGGFCVAVIDGYVELSTWNGRDETVIILSMSEVSRLRHFFNELMDACVTGGAMPEAVLRGDK